MHFNRPQFPRWLVWALAGLALAFLLWPLLPGHNLRQTAAQIRLAQNPHPQHRLLPLLSLAHAQSLSQQGRLDKRQLDSLWRELETFQGEHPVFFWMELAWLEARAGRLKRARRALARARAADAGLCQQMSAGRRWDPWREGLGMTAP